MGADGTFSTLLRRHAYSTDISPQCMSIAGKKHQRIVLVGQMRNSSMLLQEDYSSYDMHVVISIVYIYIHSTTYGIHRSSFPFPERPSFEESCLHRVFLGKLDDIGMLPNNTTMHGQTDSLYYYTILFFTFLLSLVVVSY